MLRKKFEECLKKNKVNHSHAREAIFELFLDNANTFLSVNAIRKELENSYPKKVSINTIYRHLNFFVACNLIVVLQDDNKKAYYILSKEQTPVFQICPKCQKPELLKIKKREEEALTQLLNSSSSKTPFVVIHQSCQSCNR